MLKNYLIICFFVFGLKFSWSQNVPPIIKVTGDQIYCPLTQIRVATAFNIIDPDDTTLSKLFVQISTGYDINQDRLLLTGSHPNITSSWNTVEGKLTLSGVGNAPIAHSNLINAALDVVFENTSSTMTGERSFSFSIGTANFLPSTGHYYEFISALGITWQDARIAASNLTYYGLQGYLATIGSAEESQLAGEQASGAGWIGGTDEVTEGVWIWATGPEAGTVFWNGGVSGASPAGQYANWNTREPNNLRDEDYAHITAPGIGRSGSWNDLTNTGETSGDYQPKGYIVEYGGMPGDPILDISGSTRVATGALISTTGAERCGSGALVLNAVAAPGADVIWYAVPTGGTALASGPSFTTPLLSTTTTYYAFSSYDGCTNGIRIPVVATINQPPTIVTVTDATICESGSGSLSAVPSSGQVSWFNALTGGSPLHVGSNFSTPLLTATTTYYAEAYNNACSSGTRTPVTLTVQKINPPIASAQQMFCDLADAKVSDLSANGTAINWYSTASITNPLQSSQKLETGTYYVTQTLNSCESAPLAVSVTILETLIPPMFSDIPMLVECDTDADGNAENGFVNFDLMSYESLLLNGSAASDFRFEFYTDPGYASVISNPSNFNNTVEGGQTVYVRVFNNLDSSCSAETSFSIKVAESPIVTPTVLYKNCDEDGLPDGFTDFNLNGIDALLNPTQSNDLNISYHLTRSSANENLEAISTSSFNNAIASKLYARVENSSGCFNISTIDLEISTTSFPENYLQELQACDEDSVNDGLHVFNLSSTSEAFIDQFPAGQKLNVHFYESLSDAQLDQNEIQTTTNYRNQTPFSQRIYVKVVSDDGNCYGVGPHLQLTVHPLPNFTVNQSEAFCLNGAPIVLETYNPDDNYSYIWTDTENQIVSTQPTATVTSAGVYTVRATSLFGCESLPKTFQVVESGIATITKADVSIDDLSDTNTITVNTSNLGVGNYEFSLESTSGPYQDSPIFTNVSIGIQMLYVNDKNGCGVVELELYVLGFPKFFTPNNDRFNDTWNLKGLAGQVSERSYIDIYNRYGLFLKRIRPKDSGWDGTYQGKSLPATDYWFVANLFDQNDDIRILKGHFSLVR